MGIFDRFNRHDTPPGRTFDAQPVELSEDEQALARYRYMLKTAPPETIEQAHAEAFARLTPPQCRMLLEQLAAELPPGERAYATEHPEALARLATRAEMREPGVMERMFSRVPSGGPGFGGIMGSSLVGSLAGTVLGTMIAQNFLGHHGAGHGLMRDVPDLDHTPADSQPADAGADYSDISSPLDDFGSGSDFDSGSIDI